jgi:hypothetical protein
MPLIWCSISAHGFGHAAQVVPVLNEVGRRVKDLHVILRTNVPRRFFEGRLNISWELSLAEQDIGCVQHGPLKIDAEATWDEHLRFHKEWACRVADEEYLLRSQRPDLVLSDISYLAIEAGSRVPVPCVGLCSLSWDRVLEPFVDRRQTDHARVLQDIVTSYQKATAMIRPMPGIPLTAFHHIYDVGPIADSLTGDRTRLKRMVGASDDEQLVLVGFGGIALESLPFDRLSTMSGYRFIISGPIPDGFTRGVTESSIPLPFRALLASVDLLVTKPGYGTIVEAVASGTPVVYIRRYNFADESCLVGYVHRYGRAAELSAKDFAAGRWEHALAAASRAPGPSEHAPALRGASEAADILAGYLARSSQTERR